MTDTKMLIIEGLNHGVWVELTRAEAELEPGSTWEEVLEQAVDFFFTKDLTAAQLTTATVSTKFHVGQFAAFRARVEEI